MTRPLFGLRSRLAHFVGAAALLATLELPQLPAAYGQQGAPASRPAPVSVESAPATDDASSRPTAVAAPAIRIRQDIDNSSFPASWSPEKNVRFERVDDDVFRTTSELFQKCLRKYPDGVLAGVIDNIYVLKKLDCEGRDAPGCIAARDLFVCNNGDVNLYTDAYLEGALHYYLASCLFRARTNLFDNDAWTQLLPIKFRYMFGNDSNLPYHFGVNWDRGVRHLHDHPPGFTVLDVSRASVLSEFAHYASGLFMNRSDFWAAVKREPRWAKRTDLVIDFYFKLSPTLTYQYFRKLPAVASK